MAKFHGKVGYCRTVEKTIDGEGTGVFVDEIIEKNHYGDVIRSSIDWNKSSEVNDNVTIGNQISIVADHFAIDHCRLMKYVKWMGIAWKITKIDIQYPRLILTVGGEYNGQQTNTA